MTSPTWSKRLLTTTAVILTAVALAVAGPAGRAAEPRIQQAQIIPPPVNHPITGQSSPIRFAATITKVVTTTADSGAGSLRDAIDTANGDTANDYVITFNLSSYPATITLTGGALTLSTGMTIQGPGASKLTISGNNASQVFVVNGGTSTISGLTVSGANGSYGGAIQLNGGATLDLKLCILKNNVGAQAGGGVLSYGTLTAEECTFSGDSAGSWGGGIAIGFSTGSQVRNCTFEGNSASGGAGLYVQDSTSTTVTNCTFVNNGASSSEVLFVIGFTSADVSNALMNCTIVAGHGTGTSGPGVGTYVTLSNTYQDAVTVQNTLVWADGGDFVKYAGGTFVDGGYNFDSDGTSGFTNGVNGDIVGTAGSPLNPGIGPLANNGGPVKTMALQPGSVCMDAGDPTFSNSAPTVDARGATRSGPDADGNGDGIAYPDIGAYEYQRYVVVNTNDSGAGSLRDAIDHSNTYGGEVAFAILPMGSQQVISPASPLPVISLPTFVDGWSQGGTAYKGPPLVRVDGTSAGHGAVCLNVAAPYTTVRGVDATGFGVGIEISGSAHDVWIYGCYVGVTLDGNSAAGNSEIGIWEVPGPSQVLIGTNADGVDDAAERNVIAGNGIGTGFENVLLRGSSTTVAGNYIGLGADGTTALGDGTGVTVLTPGNIIGGTAPHAGNVISGNHNEGVGILTDHTTVQGNLIGTTADGLSPLGNGGAGVVIYNYHGGDTDNHIGGSSPSARNVICDNSSDGVSLYNGASNETIQGNYIGVGSDGATLMGNHYQGVYVTGSGNTVSGNVLSGNGDSGVTLTSTGATGNVVAGNLIGVDATGLTDVGNVGPGVRISNGANHNRIGTDSGAASNADRNVIACNNRDGGGIYADNANVLLENSGTDYNTISGNWIGLDKTGSATFSPNGGPRGVMLFAGPSNNTIGGTSAYTRNVISGNQHTGIEVVGSGTNSNVIVGNFLGTDSTGTKAIGNNYGIQTYYTGNAGTRIGGTASGEGNLISGNHYNGINLDDNTTQGTLVEGNLIGTAADGTSPLGNTGDGLAFYGASGCTVGGFDASEANVIAANGQAGIALFYGSGDTFEGNSIYDNGGLGIDLGGNGVTANDAGDTDTGPDNYQNYPVLTVTATSIDGTLNSLPNEHYRIEFFTSPAPDPSGYGEGQTFLGAIPVTTDASGNTTFSYPYTSGTPAPAITATATLLDTGDTSEFSAACGAVSLGPSTLQTATASLPYNQQLTASMAIPGGSGFTFALAPGSQLPADLSLSADGLISGTPTVVGDFSFTVVATEIAAGQDACSGSRTFSLSIVCPTILINPATIPSGVKGQNYSVNLTPSAGVPPFNFEVTSGSLPAGLTLASDGTLSGTYTSLGTSTFTIKVTDKNGCTGQQTYTTSSYSLAFFDDGGTSSVCLDSTTGAFQWTVLSGPNTGKVYAGTLTIYNGGTMFWSQPGASQYVYVYYDPNAHTAWGYLYDYTTGLYTSLHDSNTLNDPAGCGTLPPAT